MAYFCEISAQKLFHSICQSKKQKTIFEPPEPTLIDFPILKVFASILMQTPSE
jgi:hypothetical protein